MITQVHQSVVAETSYSGVKTIENWELVATREPDGSKSWSIKGLLNGGPWLTSTIISASKESVSTKNSVYKLGNCAMGIGQLLGARLRDPKARYCNCPTSRA